MMIKDRIFSKDTSLWSENSETAKSIANRLGWLDCVAFSRRNLDEITAFVNAVQSQGFQQVLLLGMGGSGLAPEVFARLFPDREQGLELFVLDSTCTQQIMAFEQRLNLDKTLFIVSSKSGGTIETRSLYQYFYAKVEQFNPDNAGQQFVAITDQGSELQHIAEEHNFLKCFINPADIGGRFSALSYFGLVPAALLGVAVDRLLERAQIAVDSCRESDNSAGQLLGNWLYQGYVDRGLDKLLIVADDRLQPLIWWVEQLIAESLGKLGQGIVPTSATHNSAQLTNLHAKILQLTMQTQTLDVLSATQATWGLGDEYDVAAQFFHWEFATAVAAAKMGVNPFDEPNVTEAKQQTQRLLSEAQGQMIQTPSSLPLADVLSRVQDDSYVGILAYLPISSDNRVLLSEFVDRVQQKTNTIVTANFGPRYLHSTGQIHKGGKRQGIFIIVIEADQPSLAIPNQAFSFQDLCRAQAFGDYQALLEKGLPVSILELENPLALENQP